jgi:hypothetical protein
MLAFVFGRRIAGAVTSLARHARALCRVGAAAPCAAPRDTRIAEIDTVRAALLDSGEKLHERQQSLNAAVVREKPRHAPKRSTRASPRTSSSRCSVTSCAIH